MGTVFNAICCWRKPGSAKVGTLGLSRMLRVRNSSFTDGDAGEVGKAEGGGEGTKRDGESVCVGGVRD